MFPGRCVRMCSIHSLAPFCLLAPFSLSRNILRKILPLADLGITSMNSTPAHCQSICICLNSWSRQTCFQPLMPGFMLLDVLLDISHDHTVAFFQADRR